MWLLRRGSNFLYICNCNVPEVILGVFFWGGGLVWRATFQPSHHLLVCRIILSSMLESAAVFIPGFFFLLPAIRKAHLLPSSLV